MTLAGGGIGLGTFSIVKGACVDIDIMFINSYFCFSEFLSIKEIMQGYLSLVCQ